MQCLSAGSEGRSTMAGEAGAKSSGSSLARSSNSAQQDGKQTFVGSGAGRRVLARQAVVRQRASPVDFLL